MGGLRREASVFHLAPLHVSGASDDCLRREASGPCMSERSTDFSDDECPSTGTGIACAPEAVQGFAAVREVGGLLGFSYQPPEFPYCLGVARLKIWPSRPGSRGPDSGGAAALESPTRMDPGGAAALESLVSGLSGVLSTGVDLAVTYDFRDQGPSPRFTQAVSRFCLAHTRDWSGRLRPTTLLVKENIFSAVAQGPVHGFMRACHLGDSFVVCHGEAVAQDFHRAAASASEPSQQPARRGACSSSGCSQTNPLVSVTEVLEGGPSACTVSLEPFARKNGAGFVGEVDAGEASMPAHTFHLQADGAVRVIQTPAQSVVDVGSGVSAEAGQDAAGMAALRFHRPREQLAHLAGAHFHAGELVVDAEAEALNRELVVPPPPSRRPPPPGPQPRAGRSAAPGFLEALGVLLLRLGEGLCGAEEEERGRHVVKVRRSSGERPTGG